MAIPTGSSAIGTESFGGNHEAAGQSGERSEISSPASIVPARPHDKASAAGRACSTSHELRPDVRTVSSDTSRKETWRRVVPAAILSRIDTKVSGDTNQCTQPAPHACPANQSYTRLPQPKFSAEQSISEKFYAFQQE